MDFSTYLAGSGIEYGRRIVADGSSNAILTCMTYSTYFPTANVYQPALSGSADGFITGIASSGASLLFSSYFRGSGLETGWGIDLSSDGTIHVAACTDSTDFPLLDPYQATFAGRTFDSFFCSFNQASTGLELRSSSLLGGNGTDMLTNVVIAADGTFYLALSTHSIDFPVLNTYPTSNRTAGVYFKHAVLSGSASPERLTSRPTWRGRDD